MSSGSIDLYYNATVDVLRATIVDGSDTKKEFTTHIEDLSCHIQPFDDVISQDIEVGFGKDWLLFCDAQDIIEGDRVVYDSKQYRVVSVEKFDSFIGKSWHMEIRIRYFKS